MKSILKTLLGIIFLTAVVFFTSCSGGADDTGPSNVINDPEGIKIDLEWTTGGTVNDALEDTDLDLNIYKGEVKVDYSISSSQFERLEITSDEFDDGTYTIVIVLYKTTANVNYTATINGLNTSNPYTFTSTFASTEVPPRQVEAVTITKSGSKYTIKPVL